MDTDDLNVTRRQVLSALQQTGDWRNAASQLGIPAGLAFMIATGIPADGSGSPEIPSVSGRVSAPSSPQQLVNDNQHNPLTHDVAKAWLARRAVKELTPAS